MEKIDRADLVDRARRQLEGAIACLDEVECHQAAAYADMALHLLLGDERTPQDAVERAAGRDRVG